MQRPRGGLRRRGRRACRRASAARATGRARCADATSLRAVRRASPLTPDLGQGALLVLGDQVTEVPAELVLHERHALALDGVRDDDGRRGSPSSATMARSRPRSAATSWPSTSCACQPKARHLSSSGSTPITSSTLPSSECSLRSMIATRSPRPVMSGRHRRLPYLALVELAVAEEHEHVEVALGQPPAECHAEPGRQRVPERPRAEVDAWHPAHVGVVAERIAETRVPVEDVLPERTPSRRAADRARRPRGPCRTGSGRGRASPALPAATASRRNRALRGSPRRRRPRRSDPPSRSGSSGPSPRARAAPSPRSARRRPSCGRLRETRSGTFDRRW